MQRYLNKNELKDYLGVSLGTINNKLNELPHIKWGDNVFKIPSRDSKTPKIDRL